MIGCIIQARMDSVRLPGKVLRKLDGENPVLYYVIKQVQQCKNIEKIVVATTNLKEDDVIVKFVKKMGVEYFRGSPNDVLDRHYQCAKKFSFNAIVRATSDNPINDPQIIDKAIKKFQTGAYDCVTTSLLHTFPKGINVEIVSFKALKKVWENTALPYEREHVTPYIYNNSNKFRIFNLVNSEDLSNIRLTIDRINDLKLLRKVVSKIRKRPILLKDILKLLSAEPELLEINKNYPYNESYFKLK